MWLEQTAWIWAPLALAVLIWMMTRLVALGREVRRLQRRVSQLERATSSDRLKVAHDKSAA